MSEPAPVHLPVLLEETLSALAPRAGGCYLDGTVGLGGHAEQILERSSPDGRVIGLDRDSDALALARERLAHFGDRATLLHRGYDEAQQVVAELGVAPLDGFLLDLGVSSLQLDRAERGFSFRVDAPLDMRFDQTGGGSAHELVNGTEETALADLIWQYGEEPASRRIARAIVRSRPIESTVQLARVVEHAVGRPRGRTSPATRTFQALRIAVNHELDNLSSALDQSVRLLARGGRLVVISFHSLEDRLVKRFIQRESRDCICPPGLPECRCGHQRTLIPLSRSPGVPSIQEQHTNPRSRSAKLRAAQRT